jgi:hypothetical protein
MGKGKEKYKELLAIENQFSSYSRVNHSHASLVQSVLIQIHVLSSITPNSFTTFLRLDPRSI